VSVDDKPDETQPRQPKAHCQLSPVKAHFYLSIWYQKDEAHPRRRMGFFNSALNTDYSVHPLR
jgi:phosphoribosylaminoimidazole carboxylase (NCAIR synthetase)